MYDEDPGLYKRDQNEEARKILTAAEPLPPIHPAVRRQILVQKIAMGLLITVSVGVAGFFALAPFIAPRLAEISTTKPTPTPGPGQSVAVVVPSDSPSASAPASSAPTAPVATQRPATTPGRTAAPPTSSCDRRGYTIRGRVTIAGGAAAAGAQIDLYRAESNSYLSSFNADGGGNYAVAVVGTTNYKLLFRLDGVAKQEWWNDKQNAASANVLQVCRSDISGVNAVLSR